MKWDVAKQHNVPDIIDICVYVFLCTDGCARWYKDLVQLHQVVAALSAEGMSYDKRRNIVQLEPLHFLAITVY